MMICQLHEMVKHVKEVMENYESEEIIRQGLERKLDTMVNRELYSKYKTAPTEEEREKSRQEYLDRRGIPENFRW